MKKPLSAIVLLGLLISACSEPPSSATTSTSPTNPQASTIPNADTSQNALDWSGIYEGLLPCASCEGIQTTLILQADNHYELTSIYLGQDETRSKQSGKFVWDPQGTRITLTDGNQYLVGENQLIMLDREGKRISSALAEHYVLKKNTH